MTWKAEEVIRWDASPCDLAPLHWVFEPSRLLRFLVHDSWRQLPLDDGGTIQR